MSNNCLTSTIEVQSERLKLTYFKIFDLFFQHSAIELAANITEDITVPNTGEPPSVGGASLKLTISSSAAGRTPFCAAKLLATFSYPKLIGGVSIRNTPSTLPS